VHWLRRLRGGAPQDERDLQPERDTGPPSLERSAPGIAALFENLSEDGTHAVLDLGPGSQSSFAVYSRFAQRIRFADLLTAPMRGETWAAALRSLHLAEGERYDLVFTWNLLDRLPPKERPSLVKILADLTEKGGRLFAVVDASADPTIQPLQFSIQEIDRISQQAIGEPYPSHHQLLPAEMARLLEPFSVAHAFTLQLGFREYLAIR
jgi:hypothetical protein